MHWSDRRASVAVPDSLSYARMAGIGAEQAFSLGGARVSNAPKAAGRTTAMEPRDFDPSRYE
jgi:hypothetical protein